MYSFFKYGIFRNEAIDTPHFRFSFLNFWSLGLNSVYPVSLVELMYSLQRDIASYCDLVVENDASIVKVSMRFSHVAFYQLHHNSNTLRNI
jgi:hypothetical protein